MANGRSQSGASLPFGGGNPDRDGDKRRVLDATDIVRLIGDHLALKSKGREYVGLCPFHDDHKPSMCVVPHKQIYHCFSCGAGGDALSFVMNYHKMTFREALEHLAERANIKLTPWRAPRQNSGFGGASTSFDTESDDGGQTPRKALVEANQTASAFFKLILAHEEHGRAAREIIAKRAISPEMVEAFQLGAAPDRWDGLLLTVNNKGLNAGVFREAGLLKARDSGGFYDVFRNRLMFPITDQIGRTVAFGARRLNEQDDPKYLNSPETRLFNKSATLYGLHQAARAINSSRIAIVTEGYMDTIACHQAGVKNAVATLGTALAIENARILRRLCDTVILLFDGDAAGQKAAERAVEIFFAEPIDVRIAMLSSVTDAKDPDELLKREGGRETLDRAISVAIDPLELLFKRIRASVSGQGIAAKSRAIDEFLTRMVELGFGRVDLIRRQLITRKLAALAGVDYQSITAAVQDRLARVRPRSDAFAQAPGVAPRGDHRPTSMPPRTGANMSASEHALACILCDPNLILTLTEDNWDVLDPERFPDGPSRRIAAVVHELFVSEEAVTLENVLGALEDEDAKRTATAFYTIVDQATEGKPERLHEHWKERLNAAYRDTKVRAEPRIVPSGAASDEFLVNIARLRDRSTAIGADPRSIPRPAS